MKQITFTDGSKVYKGVFLFIFLSGLCATAIGQVQKKKNTIAQAPKQAASEVSKIVSYEVLENGDTINKLDQHKIKHGKWLHFTEGKYSDPPMYEFGIYDDDKRAGKWAIYDKEGQVMAEENYKHGLKDGEARYFENGNIYCIGNFLALKSRYEYDTILVENPMTNALRPVVIKADVGSVRHGMWTYYNTQTHQVDRVVEYQVDEIIYEKDYTEDAKVDSAAASQKLRELPHVSHKAPNNVWMMQKGKKPAKYTEFPDNMQSVKPNTRKNK